ncbi:MAG: VCBS repeat-containing protein, partial [Deltaproteobacteria bacterium]|nr:VCBS repeat-containing protein [Deltaproteobacteria bacterium]
WTIAGVADQDGDGKSDLIWRNDLLRETLLWRFESPTLIDSGSLSGMRYPGWSLAAAADFDGDGESDLLWRSVTTGQATLWLMEGFVRRQGASLASPPPASWDVVP